MLYFRFADLIEEYGRDILNALPVLYIIYVHKNFTSKNLPNLINLYITDFYGPKVCHKIKLSLVSLNL